MAVLKPSQRVSTWVADLFIIFGLTLILFGAQIFSDESFGSTWFSDWVHLTHPSYVYTGNSLARGELPLWNPYWFAGYPHLAVPHNAVFYPTTALFGFLDWQTAIVWVFFGHAYLLGVFGYALIRDALKSRLVALFVALSLSSGTIVLSAMWAGHLWSLQTLTWMPLLFLCLRRILYDGGAHWALFAALAFALMYLGGDPQTTSYVLYWLGSYTALELMYRWAIAREGAQTVLRKGTLCSLAIGLGILLVGVQLLPSQEFLAQSIRKDGVTLDYLRFMGMGSFLRFWDAIFLQHVSWQIAGKVTLALAVLSLLGRGSHERFVLWIVLGCCLTFAVMPDWLYQGVVKHVPVYNSMRGVGRIVLLITFSSYLLSAHGLCRLVAPSDDARARKRAWIQFGIILLAVMLLPYTKESTFSPTIWIMPLIAFVATASAIFLSRYVIVSAVLLSGVLAAEAFYHWAEEYQTLDMAVYEVNEEYALFSQNRVGFGRVALVGDFPVMFQGPGVGLLTGDRVLFGSHALLLYRYAALLRDVGGVNVAQFDADGKLQAQNTPRGDWLTYEALRVLDLFNVREIVSFNGPVIVIEGEIFLGSDRFTRRRSGRYTWIYENLGALYVAHIVHELIVCESDEQARIILSDFDFDYTESATITGEFDTSLLAPARGREPMTMLEYEANRLKLQADMTAPGILILSEIYYPGWKVRIDGGELQNVLCINTAFRGVFLEEGRHVVELVYRPQSFQFGLALSVGGGIIWLGVGAALWRRSYKMRTKSE